MESPTKENFETSGMTKNHFLLDTNAVIFRRNTKLKLPDSIIAATSIVLDALLLTDDEHLLKLSWPGFRKQKIS